MSDIVPTVLRVLILDDMQVRHDAFARIYSECEIKHTYTYSQFVSLLSTEKWDIIHLDHDLGDECDPDTYVNGWGETVEYNGMHAVRRVCELSEDRRPKQVIVHSINVSRAPIMVQDLQSAGISAVWEPFAEPTPCEHNDTEESIDGSCIICNECGDIVCEE